MAKPHCYFPKLKLDAYDEFVIGISFIVLILISACLGYFLVYAYLKIKRFGEYDLHERLAECKKKCYMYILLLLFITYPSICNVTLALLPPGCDEFCLDEQGDYCVRKLRTDYSIDCDTQQHTFFTYAAYSSLVYVIGFPTLLLILLYIHYSRGKDDVPHVCDNNSELIISKGNLVDFSLEPDDDECLNINADLYGPNSDLEVSQCDDEPLLDIRMNTTEDKYRTKNVERETFPLWLRFLCENYRDEFWFWEILELLRKILQTALVVLYGSDDPWYLTVTIAISVAFLTSHAYFKPMKDDFEHRLQMSSLAAIFLNLLVAMALMMPSKGTSHAEDVATTILLIVLNIIVVSLVAGNVHFQNTLDPTA